MSKVNSQIIDAVSASDLLKALNTLQKMNGHSDEGQMSFCDENKNIGEMNNANSKIINFEIYMAKKTDRLQNKSRMEGHLKSISPLKELNRNQKVNPSMQISSIKSRSHSPVFRKQQKIEKSFVYPYKRIQADIGKKQNKKQQFHIKNQNAGYRASFQSKRIMQEKQKKGLTYIPIQFRASELVKQKQIKLAKLQREKEMQKILTDKECTFKPNIIKNYKKSKITPKAQKQFNWIQEQTVRFECNNQKNEFLCTPINPMSIEMEEKEIEEELFARKSRELQATQLNEQKVGFKRYKNQKFNYLLDLIH